LIIIILQVEFSFDNHVSIFIKFYNPWWPRPRLILCVERLLFFFFFPCWIFKHFQILNFFLFCHRQATYNALWKNHKFYIFLNPVLIQKEKNKFLYSELLTIFVFLSRSHSRDIIHFAMSWKFIKYILKRARRKYDNAYVRLYTHDAKMCFHFFLFNFFF
jgi:hypothetical protein